MRVAACAITPLSPHKHPLVSRLHKSRVKRSGLAEISGNGLILKHEL